MMFCTLTLYYFISAMTTQYKTMQTKKNYTIHQLERELAQTTKQLSKRERGMNLSLIIIERERGEREKGVDSESLMIKYKSLKRCTYMLKYIHILCKTFVLHNIQYKTDFLQAVVAFTCTRLCTI